MSVVLYVGSLDELFPSCFYEIFVGDFDNIGSAKDFIFNECMKYADDDRVMIIRDSVSRKCLAFSTFGFRETPIDKPTREIVFFAENNVFAAKGNVSSDVAWNRLGFRDLRKNLPMMMYTSVSMSYCDNPYQTWSSESYDSTIIYAIESGSSIDDVLSVTIEWMRSEGVKPTYLRPVEAMIKGEMSDSRGMEIIKKIQNHSKTKKTKAFRRPYMSKVESLRFVGMSLMLYRMKKDNRNIFDAIAEFLRTNKYESRCRAEVFFKRELPKMNFILWLYAKNRILET